MTEHELDLHKYSRRNGMDRKARSGSHAVESIVALQLHNRNPKVRLEVQRDDGVHTRSLNDVVLTRDMRRHCLLDMVKLEGAGPRKI